MEAINLTKNIYEEAVKLGIHKIILSFSGGSDEGYLDIHFDFPEVGKKANDKFKEIREANFEEKVEEWVWSVYTYSGAGDGCDYGDEITYDLKNKTVHTSEWYTARQDGETFDQELQIDE